ncbi:type II toxin-antitoxin system YafQ family toxin [Anaerocaecibacter muris]|uniref:type II toxin-antitoxin system YafQ family toxin n=1 Tax=Anaerocaecibacter muris TaxID=2941513 RepID=UPI00203EA314|nr:type II toxin-antitoxin system YafQ family toxin [Anaerocaecibacter muris]
MIYEVKYTNRFEKDLKQALKRGKNLDKLFDIIEKLAKDEPLEPKNRVHMLVGEYSGYWECHIEPDWLLVYEKFDDVLVLSMYRTGTHSDLFK